jgi:prepilin-type N-terminal cleavage/methylation domain-containing protein
MIQSNSNARRLEQNMPRLTHSIPRTTLCRPNLTRRAFSLVELLTVIGILAIVMAIIIPTMNNARRTAKLADTRAMLAGLQQACSSFYNENRRDPGYFNAKDMGSASNATAGFDSMSNLMLDLMGGIVPNGTTGNGIIMVGPGTTPQTQVTVDLGGFGATHTGSSGALIKNYFVPDAKRMVAQNQPNQRYGSGAGSAAGSGGDMLPSLVDGFGSPILAWVQDDPSASMFADVGYPSTTAVPPAPPTAQFYWNQNCAFLESSVTKLGKIGESQAFSLGAATGSLLGKQNTNKVATMGGLLGNPAAADPTAPASAPRPAAPRGPIVFHSAGADGIFVGTHDKGGGTGNVPYAANQDAFNGTRFDDLIMAAGH